MWNTQTAWFDVAVVMSIFAIGNILFGHFEEHKPKLRRVMKVMLIVSLIALLSTAGLRWIAYTLIALLGLAAVYVHAWWLPQHGVNGWTAEPRDKYYELLKIPPESRRA
jgi:predicted MFS family arabinose efflux permease